MTSSVEIITGGRPVWALPHNDGCARAARVILGEALTTLLPDRLDDGLVMVSEIATNAWQHGLGGVQRPGEGRFELAVHRRGAGAYAQLVVAVFDPCPERTAMSMPVPAALARLPEPRLDESPSAEVIDRLLLELQTRQRGSTSCTTSHAAGGVSTARGRSGAYPGRPSGSRCRCTPRPSRTGRRRSIARPPRPYASCGTASPAAAPGT